MVHAIILILALPVGLVLWGLIAILSQGAYPLGSAGALDAVIFFAPIGGLILPAIVRYTFEIKPSIAVWLIAIAPIPGLLNFALVFFLYFMFSRSMVSDRAQTIALVLSVGIWVVPLYFHMRHLRKILKNQKDSV